MQIENTIWPLGDLRSEIFDSEFFEIVGVTNIWLAKQVPEFTANKRAMVKKVSRITIEFERKNIFTPFCIRKGTIIVLFLKTFDHFLLILITVNELAGISYPNSVPTLISEICGFTFKSSGKPVKTVLEPTEFLKSTPLTLKVAFAEA